MENFRKEKTKATTVIQVAPKTDNSVPLNSITERPVSQSSSSANKNSASSLNRTTANYTNVKTSSASTTPTLTPIPKPVILKADDSVNEDKQESKVLVKSRADPSQAKVTENFALLRQSSVCEAVKSDQEKGDVLLNGTEKSTLVPESPVTVNKTWDVEGHESSDQKYLKEQNVLNNHTKVGKTQGSGKGKQEQKQATSLTDFGDSERADVVLCCSKKTKDLALKLSEQLRIAGFVNYVCDVTKDFETTELTHGMKTTVFCPAADDHSVWKCVSIFLQL